MKELGCYTDGQRQLEEVDAANTWACPACAGLNNAQKIDRECQSREELSCEAHKGHLDALVILTLGGRN
eukprot:358316-Pelagomonas_calceolata.AAC.1